MMEPTSCSDVPPDRQCILHVPGKKPAKTARLYIQPFDDNSWSTVLKAAQKRRNKPQFAKSVYHDTTVNLPEFPAEKDGYHSSCYQNFTAVPSSSSASTDEQATSSTASSSPQLHSTAKDDDAKPPVCIFCNIDRKKKKDGTFELLGKSEELGVTDPIKEAAEILEDSDVLSHFIGGDQIANEKKYHHSCKSAYVLKASRCKTRNTTPCEPKKSIATDHIHEYVQKSVISDKRAELFTSVYARYLDFCSSADESPMQKFSLIRNITSKFGSKIKAQCPTGKKLGNILYNADIAADSVRVAFDYSDSEERLLNKAALLLRKQLLKAPKKVLPDNPTLDDVRDGDVTVPQPVKNFFKVFYTGNISGECGKRVHRRIDSSSQDAMFIVQRGRVKTAKHVTLGMALKSITGSKKLVQVMNRFGHCINYNSLEELETATAEALQKRMKACPEDTLPGLPFGLAFDNFDEMTQTLSGNNTLHDTMGILYQNIPDGKDERSSANSSIPDIQKSGKNENSSIITAGTKRMNKMKRSLTVPDTPLNPVFGVPKMIIFQYKNTGVFNLPDVALRARHLDLVWMMCHALQTTDVLPMWVGFNATFYQDKLPKQEVRYMPNLKEPITSLAVVRHTLETTKKCAEECNQEYGVVTYDLSAAKPAMQIQATESPTFDKVFIMMGAFHIEMAFFKAVGKLISESGGPDLLTETGVIAPGSLKGFILGKHFNRCKRVHPILALAFEILHFKAFLQACDFKEELLSLLSMVQVKPLNEEEESSLDTVINDELFMRCAHQYQEYTAETLSGTHGSTAQFWMMYIGYIQVFHKLERATRTNDIDLFITTLTPMIGLFFATAHVNYCRWLTKYQLDLLNIDDTHPGLRDILNNGAFTVRRTGHNFSRIPVDLTLEQTINADAASRLTGITAFTNNYSARLRWMTTKATRASFITLLQEMTGLITKEDVTSELRTRRIHRDNEDLRKILKQICETNNPFDRNLAPQTLYNISTGKATNEEIRKNLLDVPTKGEARHREFIESCKENPLNFERPLKKEKLKTFESGCATNRRTGNNAIAALKGSRDLMGRLLVLATKRELDMEHVLKYPLSPVPLTMATPDEVITKTDKSTLFDIFEKKVEEHGSPEKASVYIIDGQFLLHSLPPNLPPTYGGLARVVLSQCLRSRARIIHIVFDNYPQPSIKDSERDRRGADSRAFVITGPEQRRVPRDMNEALKSKSFKKQLPQFLADEWQDSSYAKMIKQHEVVLDVPGECYSFKEEDGVVRRSIVESLRNNHEEADTKICLHALFRDAVNGEIVVRASDTDIAVILLYHCNTFQSSLWMDVGTAAKNNRRYINLTTVCKELGHGICGALPAFHAYTGCDYTSSFVRKGKVRPFKLLEKSPDYQEAFGVLSAVSTQIPVAARESLMNFTASVYGAKQNSSINNCRYQKFMQVYAPKGKGKNPLANLRGIDASGLPPCESEVAAHMNRASFVARMWAHGNQSHIEQHPTEADGWELVDGQYKPIWFDGEQLPEDLVPEEGEIEEIERQEQNDMEAASSDEEESSDEED